MHNNDVATVAHVLLENAEGLFVIEYETDI